MAANHTALLAAAPGALVDMLIDEQIAMEDVREMVREEYAEKGAPADWDEDAQTWSMLLAHIEDTYGDEDLLEGFVAAAQLAAGVQA